MCKDVGNVSEATFEFFYLFAFIRLLLLGKVCPWKLNFWAGEFKTLLKTTFVGSLLPPYLHICVNLCHLICRKEAALRQREVTTETWSLDLSLTRQITSLNSLPHLLVIGVYYWTVGTISFACLLEIGVFGVWELYVCHRLHSRILNSQRVWWIRKLRHYVLKLR